MFKKPISTILALLFIFTFLTVCINKERQLAVTSGSPDKMKEIKVKPNRVLIVIGDQWKDPMSYHIDPDRVKGTDFLDVVNMLKIWGVPFDILRLDEQRLQINRFLDGLARPNYGCIIWIADPDNLQNQSLHFNTLKRAVYEYGISMIVLFDYVKIKEIAEMIGVNCINIHQVQSGDLKNKFTLSERHFITAEDMNIKLPDQQYEAKRSIPAANGITANIPAIKEDTIPVTIVNCTVSDSSKVLGYMGSIPQLVVRDVSSETKVIWIGGGKDWYRKFPAMRRILRKSLVYSIGYGLFNDNFENGFIFIMDDIGCSEHAWSLRWHYPTPRRDTLIKYLIEPLEKYGFMMVQMITPGYANPESRMIESPWTVKPFQDIFGNWQDYGSTKEGLDEGLRRGVLEIQAHRAWSHMNWDLDSPPGPWWGSPVDGELAVTDWYNEVVDVRRGHNPVPSNDLLFIYRMGIDAIKKSFGVIPLAAEVRPGAELKEGTRGGYDNGRIAAIAGLGVSRESYVGYDHTIEFSMMMPEQFTCHDLDLTAQTDHPADRSEEGWDSLQFMTTEQLLSSRIAGGRRINLHDNLDWIESRKNKHWMGFNETCAYLHASITGSEENYISFYYDDHYCRYFENNPSLWTLELSDIFLKETGMDVIVSIDGKHLISNLKSKQVLEIPPGLGEHRMKILVD